MPTIYDDRYYANTVRNRGCEPSGPLPVFNLFLPTHDPTETAVALRSAFAFLRQRGDRRYSANSLMKLLNYADGIDRAVAAGQPTTYTEYPQVLVAEVPYHYDEDTEVKQGGTVGVAVLLPDNRLMLAIHPDRRRQKVGTSMYQFVVRNHPSGHCPTIWVHQENKLGAMFSLSVGAMPRQMNNSGAVAYCERYIDGDTDNMAVVETEEWVLNEQLEQHSRAARPPRRGRMTVDTSEYAGSAAPIQAYNDRVARRSVTYDPLAVRSAEVCDDPECNERSCREERFRRALAEVPPLQRETSAYDDLFGDGSEWDEEPDYEAEDPILERLIAEDAVIGRDGLVRDSAGMEYRVSVIPG